MSAVLEVSSAQINNHMHPDGKFPHVIFRQGFRPPWLTCHFNLIWSWKFRQLFSWLMVNMHTACFSIYSPQMQLNQITKETDINVCCVREKAVLLLQTFKSLIPILNQFYNSSKIWGNVHTRTEYMDLHSSPFLIILLLCMLPVTTGTLLFMRKSNVIISLNR